MTAAPLRLALVVPFYEPDADVAPRSLQGSALGELAAALAARGHTVRAWQLARRAGTVAAGLALLMYAIDEAHAATVVWISNRNAVLAAALGFGALLLHDRAARDGDRRARVAEG